MEYVHKTRTHQRTKAHVNHKLNRADGPLYASGGQRSRRAQDPPPAARVPPGAAAQPRPRGPRSLSLFYRAGGAGAQERGDAARVGGDAPRPVSRPDLPPPRPPPPARARSGRQMSDPLPRGVAKGRKPPPMASGGRWFDDVRRGRIVSIRVAGVGYPGPAVTAVSHVRVVWRNRDPDDTQGNVVPGRHPCQRAAPARVHAHVGCFAAGERVTGAP